MPVGLVSKNCTGLLLKVVFDRMWSLILLLFFFLFGLFTLSFTVSYFGISYDWDCFILLVFVLFQFLKIFICHQPSLVV